MLGYGLVISIENLISVLLVIITIVALVVSNTNNQTGIANSLHTGKCAC